MKNRKGRGANFSSYVGVWDKNINKTKTTRFEIWCKSIQEFNPFSASPVLPSYVSM